MGLYKNGWNGKSVETFVPFIPCSCEQRFLSAVSVEVVRVACLSRRFDHQVEVHHFNRRKNSAYSLIRDQKSKKHIASGYKKLIHAFKREAVQFLVAKNLAVNHLPLEALPQVKT